MDRYRGASREWTSLKVMDLRDLSRNVFSKKPLSLSFELLKIV